MKNLVAWAMMVGLLVLPGCSMMNMKSPDEIAAGNAVEILETENGETITTYKGNTFNVATMEQMTLMCYEKEEAIAKVSAKAMSELEGIQKTMAVMHADTMDMISNVWGKEKCSPGTNEFDATIAYYKEQNAFRTEIVRTVGGAVTGVMKWGGIAYGVGKIADNMGNGDTIGGNVTTVSAGGDQSISESSLEASADTTITSVESVNDQTQVSNTGNNNMEPATNSANNSGAGAPGVEGDVPEELTEEWCNSQGMTLRESTGECITYSYKSSLEEAALKAKEAE